MVDRVKGCENVDAPETSRMLDTERLAVEVCPVALNAVVLSAFAVNVPGMVMLPEGERVMA